MSYGVMAKTRTLAQTGLPSGGSPDIVLTRTALMRAEMVVAGDQLHLIAQLRPAPDRHPRSQVQRATGVNKDVVPSVRPKLSWICNPPRTKQFFPTVAPFHRSNRARARPHAAKGNA